VTAPFNTCVLPTVQRGLKSAALPVELEARAPAPHAGALGQGSGWCARRGVQQVGASCLFMLCGVVVCRAVSGRTSTHGALTGACWYRKIWSSCATWLGVSPDQRGDPCSVAHGEWGRPARHRDLTPTGAASGSPRPSPHPRGRAASSTPQRACERVRQMQRREPDHAEPAGHRIRWSAAFLAPRGCVLPRLIGCPDSADQLSSSWSNTRSAGGELRSYGATELRQAETRQSPIDKASALLDTRLAFWALDPLSGVCLPGGAGHPSFVGEPCGARVRLTTRSVGRPCRPTPVVKPARNVGCGLLR
jgi:hypothetical protein